MKLRIGVLACALMLSANARAESRLTFPRIYSLAELRSTGFAVMNPGATNATVVFLLHKPDGIFTASPGMLPDVNGEILTSSSWLVPAKGQLSKLGSELFLNAPRSGWVEMTSTADDLAGSWIGGDFATYTDGADAA